MNTRALFLALVLGVVGARPVAAEDAPTPLSRIAFHGEVGVGTTLSSWQRAGLRYADLHVEGAVRASYSFTDWFGLQLGVGGWYFPSAAGAGDLIPIGGGVRFMPRLFSHVRLFVDSNANLGITGTLTRFAWDAGLGVEYDINEHIAVGPFARFALVMQPKDLPQNPSDALFWVAGISATWRPWQAALDSDGDGIADGADACVSEPEDRDGFEDSDGCPEADNDHDGMLDAADRCPNEAETVNGFEDEDGCPDDADSDVDGVASPADQCPHAVEDVDQFEDEDGCPDPDNDHDGIADEADQCPNDAETVNQFQDEDGCPDVAPDAAARPQESGHAHHSHSTTHH